MNNIALYQEKVEKSPLQLVPSVKEEAELLEDRINLEHLQRDLSAVFREYAFATALLFAAAAGTHYYVAKDEAARTAAGQTSESSFFSKKTLRNTFAGVGGVGFIIAGLASIGLAVNRRETKKNKQLLEPIDI